MTSPLNLKKDYATDYGLASIPHEGKTKMETLRSEKGHNNLKEEEAGEVIFSARLRNR